MGCKALTDVQAQSQTQRTCTGTRTGTGKGDGTYTDTRERRGREREREACLTNAEAPRGFLLGQSEQVRDVHVRSLLAPAAGVGHFCG